MRFVGLKEHNFQREHILEYRDYDNGNGTFKVIVVMDAETGPHEIEVECTAGKRLCSGGGPKISTQSGTV